MAGFDFGAVANFRPTNTPVGNVAPTDRTSTDPAQDPNSGLSGRNAIPTTPSGALVAQQHKERAGFVSVRTSTGIGGRELQNRGATGYLSNQGNTTPYGRTNMQIEGCHVASIHGVLDYYRQNVSLTDVAVASRGASTKLQRDNYNQHLNAYAAASKNYYGYDLFNPQPNTRIGGDMLKPNLRSIANSTALTNSDISRVLNNVYEGIPVVIGVKLPGGDRHSAVIVGFTNGPNPEPLVRDNLRNSGGQADLIPLSEFYSRYGSKIDLLMAVKRP
jgi:Peptidase_C39 like family